MGNRSSNNHSVLTHNTTTKWPLSSADEMVFEKLFRVKLRSDITAANEFESKLPLGQLQTCWLVPLFFHLCQTRTVKTLVSVEAISLSHSAVYVTQPERKRREQSFPQRGCCTS